MPLITSMNRAIWLILFACGVFASSCKRETIDLQAEEERAWEEAQSPAGAQPGRVEPTAAVIPINTSPMPPATPIGFGYASAMCLNVRDGAGTGMPISGHVFQGDRLSIFATAGGGSAAWHRVRDEAGFAEGWVSAAFVSDNPVASSYVHVDLDAYKEPKTPTVIEGISAKYVGVSACIPCHNKPHAGFALGPYGVWRDHFHSNAYQTLTRPYTRAFARKRGVDDPLTNWRCRKCHVTAYGVPAERLAETYRDEDGVGCEACHGPGGDYLYKHFREDVSAAELQAMGFRKFSNLEQRDRLCRSCHNTLSPTYKPFNVIYFSDAIRHWQNEYRIETNGPSQSPVVHAPEPVAPPLLPAPENIDELLRPLAAEQPAQKSPAANGNASSIAARLAGLPKEWKLNRTGAKGQVFFPHFKHINGFVKIEREQEVCQVCHHTNELGALPTNCSAGACHKFESTAVSNRENAFHGTCRTCHREEEAGPRQCTECHRRS